MSGFDFHFQQLEEPDEGQRWSTWNSVIKGSHGPEPRPSWVITSDAALDTELGVLKTGKEADVFLIERGVPDEPEQSTVMAAKRYRDRDHRNFHRDAGYLEGRTVRRSRDQRAMQSRSRYGVQVLAGQWAVAEFNALCRLWSLGVPVPYPVQVDGAEILMEFIGHDRVAAPRLAQVRASHDELADYFDQVANAMRALAANGQAHGDLSAYNLLLDEGRVVMIDLPQIVDVVSNPNGMEFLQRDCRNICAWFGARGYATDPEELFGELVGEAFAQW
ncbi:MAG: serine/threonine protein kinase [Actinomycetota bacterium]|nr:serine/threonine protein kinase [Actinomycetota bacterium]MDQ2957703.1 serine/threonine protein kinase [Actinomycetota bacterium]